MEISSGSSSVSEIEELFSIEIDLDGIEMGLECIKEEIEEVASSHDQEDNNYSSNVYYVVILGKTSNEEESSMEALVWTLNNIDIAKHPSATIYLIHVFPQIHSIPTPLGKLPLSQVNPEQKEKYLIQERTKRTDFLQKFLNVCSTSEVDVDTILIESDMEAKAILELIPVLNIGKLVLGTSKSSPRKLRSRRGNETVNHILQDVPESCEVSIICEGKLQVFDQEPVSPSPYPSPRTSTNYANDSKSTLIDKYNSFKNSGSPKFSAQEQVQINQSFCCFK